MFYLKIVTDYKISSHIFLVISHNENVIFFGTIYLKNSIGKFNFP